MSAERVLPVTYDNYHNDNCCTGVRFVELDKTAPTQSQSAPPHTPRTAITTPQAHRTIPT